MPDQVGWGLDQTLVEGIPAPGRGWDEMSLKVFSNTNHSVILSFWVFLIAFLKHSRKLNPFFYLHVLVTSSLVPRAVNNKLHGTKDPSLSETFTAGNNML